MSQKVQQKDIHEQPISVEDKQFISYAIKFNVPERLCFASSIWKVHGGKDAIELGASQDDFGWDYARLAEEHGRSERVKHRVSS